MHKCSVNNPILVPLSHIKWGELFYQPDNMQPSNTTTRHVKGGLAVAETGLSAVQKLLYNWDQALLSSLSLSVNESGLHDYTYRPTNKKKAVRCEWQSCGALCTRACAKYTLDVLSKLCYPNANTPS